MDMNLYRDEAFIMRNFPTFFLLGHLLLYELIKMLILIFIWMDDDNNAFFFLIQILRPNGNLSING